MINNIFDLVLCIGMIYGLVEIIHSSTIFEPIKFKILEKFYNNDFIKEFFECKFCISFWASVIVGISYILKFKFVIIVLGLHGIYNILREILENAILENNINNEGSLLDELKTIEGMEDVEK